MAAVTICSDFGAQGNKVCHCFDCFPIYLSRDWMYDGTRCHELLTYYSVIQRKYQHHPDAFLKFIIKFLFYVLFGHAQPGIEPVLSALEAQSCNYWTTWKALKCCLEDLVWTVSSCLHIWNMYSVSKCLYMFSWNNIQTNQNLVLDLSSKKNLLILFF